MIPHTSTNYFPCPRKPPTRPLSPLGTAKLFPELGRLTGGEVRHSFGADFRRWVSSTRTGPQPGPFAKYRDYAHGGTGHLRVKYVNGQPRMREGLQTATASGLLAATCTRAIRCCFGETMLTALPPPPVGAGREVLAPRRPVHAVIANARSPFQPLLFPILGRVHRALGHPPPAATAKCRPQPRARPDRGACGQYRREDDPRAQDHHHGHRRQAPRPPSYRQEGARSPERGGGDRPGKEELALRASRHPWLQVEIFLEFPPNPITNPAGSSTTLPSRLGR
jgi:hypothetical protein